MFIFPDQSYFMPTTALQHEHSDFVWKVIFAKTFVKIYLDHFGLGDRKEAEERMKHTPFRAEDKNW
jgi:hypothetical protein